MNLRRRLHGILVGLGLARVKVIWCSVGPAVGGGIVHVHWSQIVVKLTVYS